MERPDDVLTQLIERGDGVDPVEERHALAQVQSELFAEPFRPTYLSRYVLLGRLGSGGGGVVYRAYDPDLHRRVAIKVLSTGAGTTGTDAEERLLREAQAIARLSHPNVVTVHDVGSVQDTAVGDGVFVVMELVDGADLRTWLCSPRAREEVLVVMLAAGRGLAAAHAQGIVHRDFKPANVLVGSDGRARVLDFGLARAAGLADPRPTFDPEVSMSASPVLLDHDLTDVGTIMGTPAYMAPEQHAGTPADARADQYAYCVTLFQALHGERPFGGGTLDEIVAAKLAGPPKPPGGSQVPRWLCEATARGMAPRPEDRFGDMPELLEALERDPSRRRRRVMGAAALVAAVAALTYGGSSMLGHAGDRCENAGTRLEGIWDGEVREQARTQFATSGTPYALETWPKVETALDHHTSTWIEASTRACEATLVRGDRPPEEMALQVLCLDRQLAELSHVTRLLASADEGVIRNAAAMVARLPGPQRCERAARDLGQRIDLDGPERDAVLALDTRLLQAEVLRGSGKYDEADVVLDDVLERAEALGDVRSRARALITRCSSLWLRNRYEAAERACEDALAAAELGRSAALAIDALTRLVWVESSVGRRDAADRVHRIAVARMNAIPSEQRDPLQEARLAAAIGHVRDTSQRHDEAVVNLELARGIFERELGPNHPELLSVINGLGLVARGQGKLELARSHYERAIDLVSSAYGPRHPLVGSLHNNIGGTEMDAGRVKRALEHLELALEIKTQALGKRSPRLVTTLYMLGDALAALGRLEEALAHHRRAVALHEDAYGRESRLIAPSLRRVGRTLRLLGRCDDALGHLRRAKALHEPDADSDPVGASEVRVDIARCLRAAGDHVGARGELEDALQLITSTRGEDALAAAVPLLELGQLDLAVGDRRVARARLERALALQGTGEDARAHLARVQFALARAIAPEDAERAVELASMARRFVDTHGWTPEDLDDVEQWLQEDVK